MSRPDKPPEHPPEREPTRDELLTMAYVDGELAPEARRDFEARLAGEASLRKEVAALQKLEVMARAVAPPEPMDHEWASLAQDPVHSGGTRLSILLGGLGAIVVSGWAIYALVTSDLPALFKAAYLAMIAAVLIFFGVTLRARLRTLPYDPYTEVKR